VLVDDIEMSLLLLTNTQLLQASRLHVPIPI